MAPEKIKIILELKDRLAISLSENLKEVILFGSQLTGTASGNSDYDILIIVKDRYGWKLERQISDICYEIELKYGIMTDVHILSENEKESLRGKQPVFYNALNKGYYA